MIAKVKPRYVKPKDLASGETAFYWEVPAYYRTSAARSQREPLGTDYVTACGEDGKGGRAAALNGLFDEWNTKRKGGQAETASWPASATVDGCSGNTSPPTIARNASPTAPAGLRETRSHGL